LQGRSNWAVARRWTPNMTAGARARLTRKWDKAVTKSFDWVE